MTNGQRVILSDTNHGCLAEKSRFLLNIDHESTNYLLHWQSCGHTYATFTCFKNRYHQELPRVCFKLSWNLSKNLECELWINDLQKSKWGWGMSTLLIVLFDIEWKWQVVYYPCDFCERKSLTQKWHKNVTKMTHIAALCQLGCCIVSWRDMTHILPLSFCFPAIEKRDSY